MNCGSKDDGSEPRSGPFDHRKVISNMTDANKSSGDVDPIEAN